MRVGDDHCTFHGFGCGDGHLLGRLPTKESVKRQRVVWDKYLGPRCAELLEKAGAEEGVRPLERAVVFPADTLESP